MTLKTDVSPENLAALGNRIKELRKFFKISQKDFAASLSMANSYLSEIEHGKAYPAFEFFHKISKIYNVNLNYLFHGTGEMFLPREKKPEKPIEWIDEIETIDDLLWFMEHSSMFRNSIMGYAAKFLYENEQFLKKNVHKYINKSKSKSEENNDDEKEE
ncbi:MAG: helix-turn-helix domain-containing protein [Candidatus Aminicenantes bacterium]|nr:helix-turn-helix domain-containing protein [Candidatus Aminicenantes bacterium]NIM82419.1 helix-turn-helix domain-containing protein [Candidatus Aminicenantes bacterium]NIN20659.1 helix-turn-helix domain-containing protein [Candidatus Aminicenantes bacterium]NIN44438.1 helix-turn-helix domain-containing protein [Candidatus Aminicenantes bacterium]NIN87257.1 helix-turn-helix domain-containing protein [Candidatus Aminicenantes bacterium]